MKAVKVSLILLCVALFLNACTKDDPVPENQPPVVNAGHDTTIRLNNTQKDTLLLSGSATDRDGKVVGYVWSQLSGPNSAKILYAASPVTKVSGIISGQYVFQLMATDDKGATGVKSVTVTVLAPEVITLTLQPANNPTESSVYSYVPNGTGVGGPQLAIGTWTDNGSTAINRTYLKFNYTVPAGATIVSAKLSLYANPNPKAGNFVDAHYGISNSFMIQRITSAWSGSTISWNNQPSTSTTNQLIIPNSTSSFENNIDINVTQLVTDMQQYGNNGFAMRLLTESIYNIRQYVSSYNGDVAKYPKLVIQYSN